MARHPSRNTLTGTDVSHTMALGLETIGRVARFAGAKTWWAEMRDQTTSLGWLDRGFDSREGAEQAVLNRWRERTRKTIEADVERRLRDEMDYQAGMVEASNDNAEAIVRAGGAQVLAAMDIVEIAAHLAERYQMREHHHDRGDVRDAIAETIGEAVISNASEDALVAELDTRGVIPFNETEHVKREDIVVNQDAVDLATAIGDDWALFRDLERVRPLLDQLGYEVRYNGGDGVMVSIE